MSTEAPEEIEIPEPEGWADFVAWEQCGTDPDAYVLHPIRGWIPNQKPRPKSARTRRDVGITGYVSARDVIAALGCSRSQAYRHLRRAGAGRDSQGRALRISIAEWERYSRNTFTEAPCTYGNAERSGTPRFTTQPESGSNARRPARRKRLLGPFLHSGSKKPLLRIAERRRSTTA